jgi:hypothetical protein
MQKPTEGIAAEPDDMAAFNRDPDTWPFRQYWQASDMRFIELTELLENVVAGKIIVDNGVIEQCKEAVLQINQIAHVLSELSKAVGQSNLLGAMNIAYTYDARAAAARSNLTTVLSWQPETPFRTSP